MSSGRACRSRSSSRSAYAGSSCISTSRLRGGAIRSKPLAAICPRSHRSCSRSAKGSRSHARSSTHAKGTGSERAEPGEAPERVERPRIAQGLPLQAYSDDQLDDLMAWIRSDGVGRSEAREVEELRAALALRRRGSGIDAVLANAVRRTR